ncbi:MAG: magnesium protoporphyrin IX methyltransferase [Aestuariivita sp.]|nr:magnesium protoporphyrin IX methyltransferase [Aestuariivita sp.]
MAYDQTLARVETYFDQTATDAWERLTTDVPVSKVRQTVRAGRDRMRALLLSRLPEDLSGQRVLDAGCGAGQLTIELAARGASVLACDISPSILDIAKNRTPPEFLGQVTFINDDMLNSDFGFFDHVIAMDSLIYYSAGDIGAALRMFERRVSGKVVFTVAPRTKFLMGMWYLGKFFPRRDRSPEMMPQKYDELLRQAVTAGVTRTLQPIETVVSGFYFSQALELAA